VTRGRPLAVVGGVTLVAGGVLLAGRGLLQAQARTARRLIGKPLGEQAFVLDKTYRRAHGDPVRLLILGDSIAAGLGAQRPRQTLGVQLAKRLATTSGRAVRLVSVAEVGAETSWLDRQLDAIPSDFEADVAVIVVGGNDVTHRVRVSESAAQLAAAVRDLRSRGVEVVVGTCPDLGALLLLPQPLRGLAARASRRLARAQRDAVVRSGGYAVALGDLVGPSFLAKPERMFSLDRFHPSGPGYRRTAKALLPSVLAALGVLDTLPHGHRAPLREVTMSR
jgi:lysophospholipase L1-like esterase